MESFQVDIPVHAWIIQNKEEVDEILLHGGKIIVVAEDVPSYLDHPQYGNSCIVASQLLPSYENMTYYIDNNMQSFSASYMEYLASPECTIYFATVISAIVNGIPLGFVFGGEEVEQLSASIFLNFLATSYGIHLGHHFQLGIEPPMPIGWMDRPYVAADTSLLYMYNLLTPNEFLMIYPAGYDFDIRVLEKLVLELRPPVRDHHNLEEVKAYFNMYRNISNNNKRILVDPMVIQ